MTGAFPARRGLLPLAAAAAAAVAGLALLFVAAPVEGGFWPPCPFHLLTGLHCPGCGTLRGLHALLHGDPAAAFAMNPLMVLMIPVVAYGSASDLARRLRGRPLPGAAVRARWIRVLAVAVVAFGVLRNVPVPPFTALAPG